MSYWLPWTKYYGDVLYGLSFAIVTVILWDRFSEKPYFADEETERLCNILKEAQPNWYPKPGFKPRCIYPMAGAFNFQDIILYFWKYDVMT